MLPWEIFSFFQACNYIYRKTLPLTFLLEFPNTFQGTYSSQLYLLKASKKKVFLKLPKFFRIVIMHNTSKCLKGIKFRGYLVSQMEKNYNLWVFDFAIWRLQNIPRVFNFAISVAKVSLKDFVTISIDMRYTGISIIL